MEFPSSPSISVPGPWTSPEQAFGTLTEAAFAPYAVEADLPDLSLSTRAPDAATVTYFRMGGEGFFPPDALAAVAAHRLIVVMEAPPTPPGARALLVTAAALLDAGGAGVRVDGAVKVVDADRWRALAADPHPLAPYAALVQVLQDPRRGTHSLGMHYFGLPDVRIDVEMAPQTAFETVHRLNQMQIAELGAFSDGQPLTLDGREGLVLHHEPDHLAPAQHPSRNPYGRWRVAAA